MDPNETLDRIRELTSRITREGVESDDRDAYELTEAVTALDQWLSAGGFKPTDWK